MLRSRGQEEQGGLPCPLMRKKTVGKGEVFFLEKVELKWRKEGTA